MDKNLKIVLNVIIFLLIGAFVWYMATSVNKVELTYVEPYKNADKTFVSPYEKLSEFTLPADINRFELNDQRLVVSAGNTIFLFDEDGGQLASFSVKPEVRDVDMGGELIYVLYPTFIEVYSFDGNQVHHWEACSELSDYCSFAIAGDFLFVTDAENKNICKYTKEGNFVRFIQSPRGFIIPSYAFDIVSRGDTIYCVNSGRHLIERYSLDGEFLSAFGGPGGGQGFFAGCDNPSFLAFTSEGKLLTSEKGNPRISSFDSDGIFREVLLNSRILGGGSKAYEMKSNKDLLYVAAKNRMSVFRLKNNLPVS